MIAGLGARCRAAFWVRLMGWGLAGIIHAAGTNTLHSPGLVQESKPWAFQSPQKHPAPPVIDRKWPQRPLDTFVLAALERRQLRPVRPATKRELIRRATFDLIGLPPTPEECEAFEKDTDSGAYARLIHRLLGSPHYGERWARYWLDLARYADDQGNSFLSPTPAAYLYRDWVVQALNRDLPYDEFVRLQLAGDEIPGEADDYMVRLGGLGFQGLGPQFRKGAAGEAKAKADELEDRIDTLSRGILGLTVSCARCHDHKFDPIPTRDYYSLAAAYNGAEWPNRMLASPAIVKVYRDWESRVEQQRTAIKNWSAEQGRQLGRDALEKSDAYVVAAGKLLVLRHHQIPLDETRFAQQQKLETYFLNRCVQLLGATHDEPVLKVFRYAAQQARDSGTVVTPAALIQQAESLKAQVLAALSTLKGSERATNDPVTKPVALSVDQERLLKVLWKDSQAPFFVAENDLPGLLDDARKQHLAGLKAELTRLTNAPPTAAPSMPSIAGGGQAMQVFVRGNPEALGEHAPPGFLSILSGTNRPADAKQFTRLELANAITSPKNPLTARVIVNRIWHYHFGRGIVASLSNFGKLGSSPTHPELLDTLAVRFMESGWSLKWLHREIMLSATYQLSSDPEAANLEVDPGNEYLWRMTPRRLDIEAWRDAALRVAGTLDTQVGGPSVDQVTPGLQEVPDFPVSRLNGFEADNPKGRRRTLYSVISRYAPNATLTLFDFPEPNVTSDQRNITTVPQQQLFVLNSDFMIEVSRQFARRMQASTAQDEQRLNLAWQLAYGRSPTVEEAALALGFLREEDLSSGRDEKLNRWEQLAHSLLASNEFMFVP